MKNEINKPTALVRQELIENIANTINNSNLPAFIIKPILQEFLTQVGTLEQQQFDYEKQQYEQALAEQKNGVSTKEDVGENTAE